MRNLIRFRHHEQGSLRKLSTILANTGLRMPGKDRTGTNVEACIRKGLIEIWMKFCEGESLPIHFAVSQNSYVRNSSFSPLTLIYFPKIQLWNCVRLTVLSLTTSSEEENLTNENIFLFYFLDHTLWFWFQLQCAGLSPYHRAILPHQLDVL